MTERSYVTVGPYVFAFAAPTDPILFDTMPFVVEDLAATNKKAHLAVHTLLTAYQELSERNRDGWRRANAAEAAAQAQLALGEPLPGGCYRDRDGRERVTTTRMLNNCARANGVAEADCPMCFGACPGKEPDPPLVFR